MIHTEEREKRTTQITSPMQQTMWRRGTPLPRRLFGIRCLVLLLLSTMGVMHAHDDDEGALTAFKERISDHSGVLASWNRSISYCVWEGVTCSRRHRSRVVALDLNSQGISGTISPAIGNLTFLRTLNLSLNPLHGKIPPSIGSLRRLKYLGAIPSNISRCTNLRVMIIADNKGLQGSIPSEIGNMQSLRVVHLYNNSLTGTIPSSLGNLSQVTILSLAANHLEGSIPESIGNNAHLGFLQLAMNNLSGLLPLSLYNQSSLYMFFVTDNYLHGRLPAHLGRSLPSIQQFGFGNNRFTGVVPPSLTNISRLQLFDVANNGFSGVVPSDLGKLQYLRRFNLVGNKFEANNEQEWQFLTSLTNCSRLQQINIEQNRFSGQLPTSLSNLSTNIQELDIFNNNISGTIPSDIGNLIGLEVLILAGNLLTGAIPETIGKLIQLKRLHLSSTNLSGFIPSSIGNLTGLYRLGASFNSLEGPIPSSIGNLTKLSALDISTNHLSGSIPKEIMQLSSISIYLALSYNLLEGPLPSEIGNLVNLEQLILSGNQLSGKIPATIGGCVVLETLLMDGNSFQGNIPPTLKNIKGLTVLNLTNNKLNGSIPGELSNITSLQELYLAHNDLSGSIPELLGYSTSLLHLDISFNNLQGEVPKEGIFRNLTGLSIFGNNELCGGIPQLQLPKCPSSKRGLPKSLRIAVPAAVGILVLLVALALAGFLYRKFKSGLRKEQLSPQKIDLPMVSYNDILKATDGFSEANLLGKGRYGTVYKGTLENFAAAVKVFNLQQSGSYKSFLDECEALRRVRHRCLVKIITCCSSINHQGQDFRALVFELMPNFSLDRWIHPDIESQNRMGTLSLSQRLDIAVDLVDAIDYLHNGCQPSIIHCDLKPSNILLTEDMRARVGDFGIARILKEAASEASASSLSSMGIRGSIGYVAPEYGEGLPVSTYGDVYSLGITLIEMFTGRCPTDDMFRDGLTLQYFAEAAGLSGNVMEIADSNIWLHDEANDSTDTENISRAKECLAAIIQLCVLCSKQLPRERMSTSDAAAEMHAIRDAYLSSQ
ncbi:probable LRR receptor-like serine/threonine-protein kinase At3g47570 isoform X1 [Triticum urartu]|nr:probable LRR receptor-like serine/threonine-protein kinase At3g47570 isoform X1 [Triticum urartu]XP_048550661.1 probable LRR receptor-like serine/threonine-protein kinase At3g47570 isoform X1 [Triticum urartu]